MSTDLTPGSRVSISDALVKEIRERFGAGQLRISTSVMGKMKVEIVDQRGVTRSGKGSTFSEAIQNLLSSADRPASEAV